VEIHRTFGNHGKLPVKIPDEFREESVSFLHGVNALQPQFFDESILEGLVDLFDSPFGLGAVGEYELDAKIIHRSPELCFSVAVFYSCGKSFGRVHPEDSMAIKVERERFPVRFQIRSGCAKVGIGRFTYGKRKMQEFTGSIVNVNEERAGGARSSNQWCDDPSTWTSSPSEPLRSRSSWMTGVAWRVGFQSPTAIMASLKVSREYGNSW